MTERPFKYLPMKCGHFVEFLLWSLLEVKEFTDLGAAVRSIFYSFADDALCKLTLQRNERIPNKVLQSRNPHPKFRAIP